MLTHRGLSPHQFTPMSGAHKPDSANPAMTLWLTNEDQSRRVADLGRYARMNSHQPPDSKPPRLSKTAMFFIAAFLLLLVFGLAFASPFILS